MDRIKPYHAWPLGMGVLIAALPGVTVAIVVIVVALLAVGAVILVASRRHAASDPPLENEVLGEWFEPETATVEPNGTAAEANGKDPAPAAAPATAVAAAAVGAASASAGPAASGTSTAPAAMRAEMATDVADDTDVPTTAYTPHVGEEAPNGASTAAPAIVAGAAGAAGASNGWPSATSAAPAETDGSDGTGGAASDGEIAEPFGGDEFDYGSLERDLGFTERTGGALAVGIASVILVVLLGLWLVAATHHGAGTPVHIVHTPIPGPPGPQGSPAP